MPSEVKAKYIFYIDNLNIQPMNRNRMFRRLKEFVPTVIGPERGRHGRDLQPVAEGAARLHLRRQRHRSAPSSRSSSRPAAARRCIGECKDTLARIATPRPPTPRSSPRGRTRSRSATTCEFTIDAIKETLDSLAGLQGRKSLLYMSEGPARHRRPRALRGHPREVPGHDGDDAAVRLRHEHEVREDRPGRQRERRHDLHARRVGTDDRRRAVGRHETEQGRARQRVHGRARTCRDRSA